MKQLPIKVGVIAEQTGPLSFMGIANANVAKMVIDEINAAGGLLGRRIDLYVEDGATIDSVAEAKATKLIAHDKVDVIFGGIYSSTRQAIKGPAVVKGRKLYIYPEQYEGQECDPLIFCTGPVPAQQVDPFIPWLMQQTGGSLKRDDVIKALDHAKIAGGPGGPAEMVPGQHHVRMNMYIAQASNGIFKIVKSLGVIDPKEANVPGLADAGGMRAAV